MGSANLTGGGLLTNIEGSLLLSLELDDGPSERLVREIESKFDAMVERYPIHIYAVTNDKQIETLMHSGRVVDEESGPSPTSVSKSANDASGLVPRMPLKTTVLRSLHPKKPAVSSHNGPSEGAQAPPVLQPDLEQVWITGPLTRRDLNIPTGAKTNPTGSMLLKKGALPSLDQLTYFRHVVFAELDWQADPASGKTHIERAMANVQIIVSGIDYGTFQLRISHNSDTSSTTYTQGNSPTSLHWDAAKPLVANEHLLDRVARLFRNNLRPGYFVLQID